MRLVLGIALLLSLAMGSLLVDASAQTQVACTLSTCTLTVSRIILTNDWGTTFMNDTVSLNANASVTYLDLGVPSQVADKLGFFIAVDSQGATARVTKQALNQTGGYLPLRVELPGRTGVYSFTLRTVFSGLLSFEDTSKRYTLTYSPFPVVDNSTSVTTATLTIKTGDWSSITPSGIQGTTSSGTFQTQASNLKPFNTTLGKLSFASPTQLAFDVAAGRLITISQSAKVQVSDTYNITNRGRDTPSLAFLLPKGAASVSGSDVIGRLDETKIAATLQPNGTTAVTFTPRFGTVKNGGGVSVKLDYELSSDLYVTTGSLGRYSLNFQMFSNVKFVESALQTKIRLPTGFKLDSVTVQTATVTANQILLEATGVNPLTDLSFSISYRLDPFWASLGPLGWAGLLEAALAAAVLVFVSGSTAVATTGLAPSSLIGRFVELFDEKAALRLESEKLEDDIGRGAVSRHDFKRRKRVMDLRVSEIDRQLGPTKQELAGTQPRYGEMVKKIERAEAELQVVRSSMSDLRNQYRSGRMAKELYESLVSDLVRRKERTQQTIDNVVIGLREEAR